jgi:hypothetical protein
MEKPMSEMAEMLRSAVQAVREVGLDPDSPAGVAAIQEFLRSGLNVSAPSAAGHTPATTGPPDQDSSAARRAAEGVSVGEDRVQDIVDFGVDGVALSIHGRSLPSMKAGRQRMLALLKLALDRVAYDRDQVQARELSAILDQYDCLDQNVPKNLETYENYITRRGQRRGGYSYRITQYGLDRAREELRSLLDAA